MLQLQAYHANVLLASRELMARSLSGILMQWKALLNQHHFPFGMDWAAVGSVGITHSTHCLRSCQQFAGPQWAKPTHVTLTAFQVCCDQVCRRSLIHVARYSGTLGIC